MYSRNPIRSTYQLTQTVMKPLKLIILTLIITLGSLTSAVKAESFIYSAADTTALLVEEQIAQNERIEEILLYGLSSETPGVVESVLFNTIHYKMKYPSFTSESVVNTINQIALEGSSHTIRYKAYLTLAYYKYQEQFGEPDYLLSMIDNRNQNEIFFYLNDKVQEGLATTYN